MSVDTDTAGRQSATPPILAASRSDAVKEPEHNPPVSGSTESTLNVGGGEDRGHVLIVEDDLIIADLIDQILRFESFRVAHVIDGQSAVEYAKQHQPDLILMDLMLPIMSGIDASRLIKSDEAVEVSQIPIVAMSAGVNLRAAATGLVVEGVLAKPFDIDELLATVDIHIRRSAASVEE